MLHNSFAVSRFSPLADDGHRNTSPSRLRSQVNLLHWLFDRVPPVQNDQHSNNNKGPRNRNVIELSDSNSEFGGVQILARISATPVVTDARNSLTMSSLVLRQRQTVAPPADAEKENPKKSLKKGHPKRSASFDKLLVTAFQIRLACEYSSLVVVSFLPQQRRLTSRDFDNRCNYTC